MRYLLCLIMLLVLLPAAVAQEPISTQPLIYNSAGDLWQYDPVVHMATNITGYGYNEAPILNGATGLIAYSSLARAWIDAAPERSGPSAMNIWVIDPVTTDAFRVADQPADASLELENFIYRSEPTWSPDGSRLAWTDYEYSPDGMSSYFIAVYDMVTRTAERYSLAAAIDLTTLYGVPGPLSILWSPDGDYLVIPHERWDEKMQKAVNVFAFFDPAIQFVGETIVPGENFVREEVWLNHQGVTVMGAYMGEEIGWYLINPDDLSLEPYTGGIRGDVTTTQPAGLHVFYIQGTWIIEFADGTNKVVTMTADQFMRFSNVALSPDGQYLAYAVDDHILRVVDANDNEVSSFVPERGVFGLAWGEMQWSTVQ